MDAVYEDPQARARQMAVETRRADGSPERHIGAPVKLSRTPWAVRSAAPELGEHSEEVLAEYGIGAEEIASLREAGVVAGPPGGRNEGR
jgi:crotonobetainyl-CoA:carnitine CoA-transferase CaiB-like acyl-CoA transferase